MKRVRMKNVILLWLPLPVLGVLNGIFRGLVLNLIFSDFVARQFSALSMIFLIVLHTGFIFESLHIKTSNDAWFAGIIWLFLTIGFEFALGFALGSNVESILAEYNLFKGRLWILVLVAVLVNPFVYFKFGDHESFDRSKEA